MTTRHRDAEIVARTFLDQFGVDWITDVGSALSQVGLDVREVEGVSFHGALIRVAGFGRGIIAVRGDIREEGRKLFTVAHEVGHYLLPQHGLEPALCRGGEVQSWSLRLLAREQDANTFAAEILIPREVVLPLAQEPPSFAHINDLASRRRTSLTATGVRYVELAERRLALVYSQKGEIAWYRASVEFKRGIPIGQVGRHTVAGRLFSGGDSPNCFVELPAIEWLYDVNLREDSRLLEWSRPLPLYDAVLTLLYIEEPVEAVPAPEDADDRDGEMDPVEFTLERRRWPRKR